MKISLVLWSVFFGVVIELKGQEFAPTGFPDRIALTLSENPTSEIVVNWRTDTTIQNGYLEFLPAPDGPDMKSGLKRLVSMPVKVIADNVAAHCFSVQIKDLNPSGIYAYRVSGENNWSEWFQFTTAAGTDEDFSFVYMGDVQADIRAKWSRVARQAFKTAPDAAFYLYAGDIINRSFRNNEWGEWHHGAGFIHSMTPLIATPGNHEYTRSLEEKESLCPYWKSGFNFPENGPTGLKGTVYYVDYQGARFISLDGQMITRNEELRRRQYNWLEKVLLESRGLWKIIMVHHPLYATRSGRDNKELRELFEPLFVKYGVHLVLQGHDHTYARGTVPAGEKKPVYVVSVSGPKMYKEDTSLKWPQKTIVDTQLYQVIEVRESHLSYKAYTATGKLADEFELDK